MPRPPSSYHSPPVDGSPLHAPTITPLSGLNGYPIRKPLRLAEYDYSRAGLYFVTIRSHRGTCLFGSIGNGEMHLSCAGAIVVKCWLDIPMHYSAITPDCYVVMPNHVHGILFVHHDRAESTARDCGRLSNIIGSFKSAASKQIHLNYRRRIGSIWQRGYYEHVIRRSDSLDKIREYIVNNPAKWELDEENPSRNASR